MSDKPLKVGDCVRVEAAHEYIDAKLVGRYATIVRVWDTAVKLDFGDKLLPARPQHLRLVFPSKAGRPA